MRILVTGGAGFIGSNFVRHILQKYPSDTILVLDKLTYAGNLRNLEEPLQDSRVQFVRMDIADAAVSDLAKECDAVAHFAAESHVDRSIEDATPFVRTNVEGTWRLIDACRAARVGRFIHVSTDEVYGSLAPGVRATESSALAPTSPYAASKASSDLLVLSAVKTYRFPAIITRCTNNYGPYQFPEKFIPLMISQAIACQPLPVYGDGLNVRDWIHVLDHCHAIDLILRKGIDGEIYNIGGECELENIALAKRILAALDRSEGLVKFVSDRLAHDRRYALNCTKLKDELGWSSSRDFESGLADTIQWYRENSDWLDETRSGDYRTYFERHYVSRGLAHISGR